MNKRIKELARLSGFNEYTNDDGADDENLTKFAGLLIDECITIVQEIEKLHIGMEAAIALRDFKTSNKVK